MVILVVVAGVALPATPADAGSVPIQSSAFGMSRAAWGRVWGQWALGDASNPLIASLDGDCGDVVGHAFLMVAPIIDQVELDCDVPRGTPIVFTHAGFFAWIPADGSTDAQIVASAEAGFAPDSSEVTLDGATVPLGVTNTGAFDIVSEPGSFYDAVIGLGTGPIRSAIAGQFTILGPQTPATTMSSRMWTSPRWPA